tara:strand:+ start:298 stop:1227 length:930 start_codon:yes stop_codon:yes gene_type:complete
MSQDILSQDLSASVREAFNFNVEKYPLSAVMGTEVLPTDQYGLFRDDTGYLKGVKSVSPRYVPHTTDDVCALVDAAGEAFEGEISCDTHFRNGHYVSIAPTNAERLSIYKDKDTDNVFPRVVINAGYDGKAFSATMGYYRDACDNLAMMRQVSGTTVAIRHTSGLRGHMDTLIAAFNTLKNSWGSLTAVIENLESQQVRIADFLNEIYAQPSPEQLALAATGESVRAVTTHQNRTEAIWKRLNRERLQTGRPEMSGTVSAWEAYNAIQGYVQHDAQAKSGFKGSFDRILRASNDASVRKAEKLVLSLVA